jgi:hypothetical protein
MFSVNVVLGASSVADAVDLMADSSAPKKSTCMTKGIFSMHQRGQHLLWIVLEQGRPSARA